MRQHRPLLDIPIIKEILKGSKDPISLIDALYLVDSDEQLDRIAELDICYEYHVGRVQYA